MILKSITIHGLDSTLDRLIREQAALQGISLNKTIKNLLRQSLGIATSKQKTRKTDFMEFLGVWSKRDEDEFIAKAKDFEKIDKRDWK